MLNKIVNWLKSRRSKPLSELLEVRFDDDIIEVIVLEELDDEWNQTFRWEDINRICFKDGGMMSSDLLYFVVEGRDETYCIPTEAKGGSHLFGAITEKDGLFPEKIWRKAVGSTNGGMYCWPPHED